MCSKRLNGGGTYVDIGAHHPIRYSNTYLLYLNGWSGINIDPQIGVKEMFDEYRPDDINLGIGIGRCEQDVVFYNFEDPAFNTTNSERGDEVIEQGLSKLVEKRRIKVYPLSSILDKYMDHGRSIDFMNIDMEKSELDVLQSNDWSKYRPKMIALEVLGVDGEAMEVVMSDKSIVFLRNQGYEPVGRVGWEVFLKDMKNTMAIDE